MGQAYRRFSTVDVLTACAAGAHYFGPDILLVDLEVGCDFLRCI